MKKDNDGRIIINMQVLNDDEFLSPFSMSEVPVINSDVADFIENSTINLPPKEKLRLIIHSDCIDDNEKILYDKAIKEYYQERYTSLRKDLIRNYIAVAIMFIVGAIILTISVFKINTLVKSEIIDIVAWVLIWEACDISFFTNHSLRIKKKRYKAYIDMDIVYKDSL